LFPKFSICDPTVIESLPKRQLQNGVVMPHTCFRTIFNLSHEGYLQDRIAESILQNLIQVGPEVVENPKRLCTSF
jgi:NADP-dependent alcohol dehydrogenase